jgi:hypothetical protein
MDPRLIVIIAAMFVAAAGFVCLAPDQIPLLRLPQQFLQLGMERTVTGLALMLLGFLVALSEMEDEKRPTAVRRGQPFAFGEEEMVPAGGELRLEPEPDRAPPAPTTDAQPVLNREPEPEPEPAPRRRPDLYKDLDEPTLAVVPKRDTPASPEP